MDTVEFEVNFFAIETKVKDITRNGELCHPALVTKTAQNMNDVADANNEIYKILVLTQVEKTEGSMEFECSQVLVTT